MSNSHCLEVTATWKKFSYLLSLGPNFVNGHTDTWTNAKWETKLKISSVHGTHGIYVYCTFPFPNSLIQISCHFICFQLPVGFTHPMINPEALFTSESVSHGGRRKFSCNICNRIFTSETGIRSHANWHMGQYPYRCEHCGRGFLSSTNYKGHLSKHRNVKDFACEICGKRYVYKDGVVRHMITHHPEAIGKKAHV